MPPDIMLYLRFILISTNNLWIKTNKAMAHVQSDQKYGIKK